CTGFMLIVMTGCMKTNIDINVNSDGTYTTSGYFYVEEKYLTDLNMTMDDVLSLLEDAGFHLTQGNYEESATMFEDANYTGIKFSYTDGDLLNVTVDGGIKKIYLNTYDFPSEVPDRIKLNVLEDDISDYELLKSLGIEATMNITFPGKILEYSNGEKTAYNKLKIDLLQNYNDVEVVSYASLLNFLFFALAFVAVVLVIVIYYKKRIKAIGKKKENTEQSSRAPKSK
ncbi:MAG: hypothetical protein KIG23_07850, partial [Erysipelotrichaceae bacterium]|nr:hypothetical protein [Erysipelotrichaceae bacterium]